MVKLVEYGQILPEAESAEYEKIHLWLTYRIWRNFVHLLTQPNIVKFWLGPILPNFCRNHLGRLNPNLGQGRLAKFRSRLTQLNSTWTLYAE